MKDLFGKALLDYYYGNYTEDIITETSISEEDVLPLSYLFRDYNQMPKIEQKALDCAIGSVLDVGAGAGSHALYLQNTRLLDVTAIDISKGAIEVCKLRGITKTKLSDLKDFSEGTFDTILILMNGSGIFGRLKNVPALLLHLKSLLNKNGKIFVDSSDIIYMFDDDPDGGKWVPGHRYYGELEFKLSYKNETEAAFSWLYIDFNTLKNVANSCGLQCELIIEGEHYDYLACLFIE